MKAIGYTKENPDQLIEAAVATPELGDHDVLVEVKGISLNPVDLKIRERVRDYDGLKILGYDGAGIVKEIGAKVSHYKIGDEVFYAGDVTRQGTNAQFHAVDERIVGTKPKSLDFAEAAAIPLTAITAWELLFDSLKIKENEGAGQSLLIIGGAGGVGSMLIQLAKKLTKLTVIATASRADTIGWVKKMGADGVINHREDLASQMKALNIMPSYVASLNGTQTHYPSIIELIEPKGTLALIDDPDLIDIKLAKPKSLTIGWEFMFAHSMFQTKNMESQRLLLNRVAHMIDEGVLLSTMTNNLGEVSADSLEKAHKIQASGRVIGKNVLSGFK